MRTSSDATVPPSRARSGSRRLGRALVLGGAGVALVGARRATRPRPAVAALDDIDSGCLPDGQHRTVTTEDGAQLAVTVAGPQEAHTVVLPHCWTGSRAVWGPVAHRLVAAGHRVVLYDQRGHGDSTGSDAAPSIPLLGHDLRAVMDAVDVQEAILVGHSMGGMTIQSYAAEHPDDFVRRARGIVLVATAARVLGRALPSAAVARALGDRPSAWTRQGRVGRAVVRGSLGPHAHPAHIDLTLQGWVDTTGAARAGFLTAMSAMDLRHGLADIGVPTSVLVGTRDRLTPPRLARQLVDGIPGAELTVLRGLGHMLPLEAPDQIVDAVAAVNTRAGREPADVAS